MKKQLVQIGSIRPALTRLVVLDHSIILYSAGWERCKTTRQVPFLVLFKNVIHIPHMPLFFCRSDYLFVFAHQKDREFCCAAD